jgi:hypothetical protein
MILRKLAFCTSICFSAGTLANDSIARIGSTGLVLVKSDSIQMKKEILEISEKSIKVKYEFMNVGKNDIETLVAFPMPVYGFNLGQSASDMNVGPIADFNVSSNGNKINVQPHFKALLNNREVSSELKNIGLTDTQIFSTFAGCKLTDDFSCEISQEQINQLKKISAFSTDGFSSSSKYPLGSSWPMWKYGPAWDVEQTLTWKQNFAANKITDIRHSYTPLVGGVYNYPIYNSILEKNIAIQAASVANENNTEACIDDGFKKAYAKKLADLQKSGVKSVQVSLSDVEYVLGTGKNWAGPIQEFTLRIKKQTPDQLVSLCFPGTPKKIDPLTLEFNHRDLVPQDKLIVYFYSFRAD